MKTNIREQKKIGTWLINGDTGQSSLSLAAIALGGNPSELFIPHDSSDFKRCYEFLNACIDPSKHFTLLYEMAEHHAKWKTIKDNWLTMRKLYEEEYKTGKADKLYKLMDSLEL